MEKDIQIEVASPLAGQLTAREQFDTANDAAIELKRLATAIYEKMRAFPSNYGFHFSYSPERCWRPDTKILILTTNPQAMDTRGKPVKIVPDSPWPKINDFFDDANAFRLKRPVQALCYELSRLAGDSAYKDRCPVDAARYFADDHAVIASFAPFRTENANQIDGAMLDFSKTNIGGRFLKFGSRKSLSPWGGRHLTV